MPKTKEITFKCANAKVEPDAYKSVIVTVERPEIDEIFGVSHDDDVTDWVRDNYEPEDVFSETQLEKWAEANGYVKE